MKPQISAVQYAFLLSNFFFSAALISMHQVLAEVAGQNAWIVPIMVIPFVIILLWVTLGREEITLELLYNDKESKAYLKKGWALVFLLFLALVFIRDVRSLSNFIGTVLLPTTPITAVAIFTVLVVCYTAWGGLEVVARLNGIYFSILTVVILSLPLMLVNEMNVINFQPILRLSSVPSLFQGTFLLLSWTGEIIIAVLLAGFVHPAGKIKKAASWGGVFGIFLFFLLALTNIAVLGPDIVKYSSYPNYVMIQEINITDFLDRLDLAIVTLWLPTLLCKLSINLYCINCALDILTKKKTKVIMVPLSLLLGILSILLFKDNLTHQQFSFYTWASMGLLLELLIAAGFIVIRKMQKRKSAKTV